MDLDKKKTGIFRWLVSMSDYKRGLLGIGRGVHSTECPSSCSLNNRCEAQTVKSECYT